MLADVEQPTVLVTTSSEFQDDGRLVRCAREALADEPVYVIATLPSGDPQSFDAPPNARILPFIPHAPILDRAACAITHGGTAAADLCEEQLRPVVCSERTDDDRNRTGVDGFATHAIQVT